MDVWKGTVVQRKRIRISQLHYGGHPCEGAPGGVREENSRSISIMSGLHTLWLMICDEGESHEGEEREDVWGKQQGKGKGIEGDFRTWQHLLIYALCRTKIRSSSWLQSQRHVRSPDESSISRESLGDERRKRSACPFATPAMDFIHCFANDFLFLFYFSPFLLAQSDIKTGGLAFW
jgi:hypothetical protein